MARVLWVRGTITSNGRTIQGVYSRKSKALHGCSNPEDFVASAVVNEPFPGSVELWENMEFPCRSMSTK